MSDFQDTTPAADVTAETSANDAWESGATERAQERLAEEDRVEALYGESEENAADRPAEAPPAEPAPKPAPKVEGLDVAASDALWSTEDVQIIAALQQRAQAFQAELAKFAEAKQADIDALAGGDKAKAAALRQDLKDWENRLTAEHQELQQAGAALRQKAEARQAERAKARLEREQEKLGQLVPDLDKRALRTYLTERAGFTEEEVLSVADARLVALAEKARRFDELMANGGGPKPRKVPRFIKGRRAVQQDDEPEVLPSLSRGANIFERLAAMEAMYPSRPTRRRSVQSDDPATILYGKAS